MKNEELLNIAKKHSTPSFLFDIQALLSRIKAMKDILDNKYELCFAMKANPFLTTYISKNIEKIEVCSPGELQICITLNIPASQIIYSGVVKGYDDVVLALEYGVKAFTAESLNQLELINKCTLDLDSKICILLRLSTGSQFGMGKKDIIKAINMLHKYQNIKFSGLHYYAGTQRKKIDLQLKDLNLLLDLKNEITSIIKMDEFIIEYGPGLNVSMFEDDDFSDTLKPLSILKTKLDELNLDRVKMRIELGRFMVQYCGYYLASILDVKNTGECDYCLLDGGINHVNYYGSIMGMKIPIMRHISINSNAYKQEKDYCICGALCTSGDVLVRRKQLDNPQIGDLIVFENIGAYSVTEGIYLFLSRALPKVLLLDNKNILVARDFKEIFELNF
ncbi:alanine racemase [Campylobacter sp. IFREMER_LSEM_CL2127]|uniref:diaminopimelate decarboxylase family protein n=1 Tax=Campylobacter sp. IFREMER_LSEM_CL2127 TaxID=2911619 RepID=UPI0021E8EA80|nr:alanine racemase [Campylobacter sp. IFREMER_LSEM_CL2127]MCV3381235.1 alanine racemase [Campylobacter sp. IFREMER_LSEM_CL2127]